MDKKELNASNFMPVDLLEIICILERREKHKSYKIIRKRNYFSLITKFPTKNGESTPLKNSASANGTATHQNKKEVSSDDKLPNKRRKRRRNKPSHASRSASHMDKKHQDYSYVRLAQPKPKKKSPAQVAGDHARRKEFWKHMKLPRQFRAENLALHYLLLETQTVASPQSSVVSQSENSSYLDRTSDVSQSYQLLETDTVLCGQSVRVRKLWLLGSYI